MQTEEGRRKARETMIKRSGSYEAYIERKRIAGKKGGLAHHNLPTGFGSNTIGKDGLTGKERAKKLADERRGKPLK